MLQLNFTILTQKKPYLAVMMGNILIFTTKNMTVYVVNDAMTSAAFFVKKDGI